MKKAVRVKKFIIFLLAVICLSFLSIGYFYWEDKIRAINKDGQNVLEKNLTKEKLARVALINELNPKSNKKQSIQDLLLYKELTQSKVIVSVLGSSPTAGVGTSSTLKSWPELLKTKLISNNDNLDSLQLINHGYKGYSTTDLLIGKKIDSVIKEHPDLVIFENAMINNYLQSISIEQTKKDLEDIMSKMQEGLQNTKIIIMSPNPMNSNNKNSLGLTYTDYINASEKVSSEHKWLYFNSNKIIREKLKSENILLADILSYDYVSLNDRGNLLWADLLFDYFGKEN